MQSVDSRSRSSARRLAAVLIVTGLAGPLAACGGTQPTTPHVRAVAAAPTTPAAPSPPPASPLPPQTTHGTPAPQITRSPKEEHTPDTPRTPQTTPRSATTPPPAPRPTSPAAPAPTPGQQQRLPEGRLTVDDTARLTVGITGLPASPRLVSGGVPVEFTVTLRNTGNADYPMVAPVVRFDQYDGGLAPLGSVAGRLERLDPATRTWREAPLPQSAGMDFLLVATGGVPLPEGAATTIRYRVTLAPGLRAGRTELQAYAVSQPSNQQAGKAATEVTIVP
ncbi:hypothetical protein ACFVP0_16975 [Streptomyces cinereoruber]|uniref:hypothetical protein n=1 Tax=Streptomyces cinereoruber TaxID=67260 RepID=UPI0036CD0AC7